MCAGRTVSLLVAVLLSWASIAAGEERPSSVAILGITSTADLRDRLPELEAMIADAAATETEVVDLATLRLRRDALIEDREREQIPSLRATARASFLAFDFPAARQALEQARTLLRQRFAPELRDPELGALDLELARVLLDMNEREAALAVLHEVTSCCPTIEPSVDDFPPRFLEAWAEVRGGVGVPTGSEPAAVTTRLAQIGAALEVTHVITGELGQGDQGGIQLTLTLIDAGNAEILNEGRITLGEPSSWAATCDVAVPRLLSPIRPPAPPADVGRLLVLSEPPGATISVDGVVYVGGVTPMTIQVSPGRHLLTLTLDGHHSEELYVNAWSHQTQPIEVVLSPREEERRRNLWWVWTLVGVAVAGAAAGLIYWGVRESQELPDATVNLIQAE